jgi:hypothetical protein
VLGVAKVEVAVPEAAADVVEGEDDLVEAIQVA